MIYVEICDIEMGRLSQIEQQFTKMARPLAKMSNMMEEITKRLEKVEYGESPRFNKKLESVVHRLTNTNFYFKPIDNTKLERELSETFSTIDIPKFKPIENLKYYLRNFRSTKII